MKIGKFVVLIVGLISIIKCDLIKDVTEIGLSIMRRVLADEREFGFNMSVSLNAEAYQELIKFNTSVIKKSKEFLLIYEVDNLKSFIDSFNKSVASTIDQFNLKYSPSKFHVGIEYIREKYGNTILMDLNNRTEYFQNFLNHSLNLNNCTIFKFIHKITDTITVLSGNIPLAVKEEAENYSTGLSNFKNILVKRETEFENAITNCFNIKTTSVECCVDIYLVNNQNTILNEINLHEATENLVQAGYEYFDKKFALVSKFINKHFEILYNEIEKC